MTILEPALRTLILRTNGDLGIEELPTSRYWESNQGRGAINDAVGDVHCLYYAVGGPRGVAVLAVGAAAQHHAHAPVNDLADRILRKCGTDRARLPAEPLRGRAVIAAGTDAAPRSLLHGTAESLRRHLIWEFATPDMV